MNYNDNSRFLCNLLTCKVISHLQVKMRKRGEREVREDSEQQEKTINNKSSSAINSFEQNDEFDGTAVCEEISQLETSEESESEEQVGNLAEDDDIPRGMPIRWRAPARRRQQFDFGVGALSQAEQLANCWGEGRFQAAKNM